MDIKSIIAEEIQGFQKNIYTIQDLAQIMERQGYDEYGVKILADILLKAYRVGGDAGVIETYKEMAGVQIEAISKGRYMFANLYDPEALNEVGEGSQKIYPYKQLDANDGYTYVFQTEDNDNYTVYIYPEESVGLKDYDVWTIEFNAGGGYGRVINQGRLYRVMATIMRIGKQFMTTEKPDMVVMHPSKNSTRDNRRMHLYQAYIGKALQNNSDYEIADNEEYLVLIKKRLLEKTDENWEMVKNLVQRMHRTSGDEYDLLDMITDAMQGNIKAVAENLVEDVGRHSNDLLYHVTDIKNYEDVKKYGLLPQFGETVKQAYADYYKIDDREDDPEDYENQRQELEFEGLLFFSEKPILHYAHAGLGHYDLKWNQVLLCVVEKNESIYHKVDDYPRFEDSNGEQIESIDYMSVYDLPIMIETGDWFSFEEQGVVDLIYGQRLQQFMQANFEKEAQRIVAEEIMKLEGVGDRYAQKQFGIPDTGMDFEKSWQEKLKSQDTSVENGKLVGEITAGGNLISNIYMNPTSLRNFDADARAITSADGNLYVAQIDAGFFHETMGYVLRENGIDIGNVNNNKINTTWHRLGNSNRFGLSITYVENKFVFDDKGRYDRIKPEYESEVDEMIKAVSQAHPEFEFVPMYWSFYKKGM